MFSSSSLKTYTSLITNIEKGDLLIEKKSSEISRMLIFNQIEIDYINNIFHISFWFSGKYEKMNMPRIFIFWKKTLMRPLRLKKGLMSYPEQAKFNLFAADKFYSLKINVNIYYIWLKLDSHLAWNIFMTEIIECFCSVFVVMIARLMIWLFNFCSKSERYTFS